MLRTYYPEIFLIVYYYTTVCYQTNIHIVGSIMCTDVILKTRGPRECQSRCHSSIGCVWFAWKKPDDEELGYCSRISRVTGIESNSSTKGIISGPARCGGMSIISV